MESCYECPSLIEEGEMSREEIEAEHKRCHGWFHCSDCCGPCPVCNKEGSSYDWDEDDL